MQQVRCIATVILTLSVWNQNQEYQASMGSQSIHVPLEGKTEEERSAELFVKMSRIHDNFERQGITVCWSEVPGTL